MSCEDSLSQSLLEPSEASKQEQVPVLLEEVKSLQDAVLHEIDKEGMSLTYCKTSSWILRKGVSPRNVFERIVLA